MNPRLLVLFTIVIWTLGGLGIKLIASSNMFAIMSIALLTSSFSNYLFLKKIGGFEKSLLTFSFVSFSLFGYFFYWMFFLHCVMFYDGQVSIPLVLNYTWPFFTALFTLLLYKREKLAWQFIISAVLGVCGIVVLFSKGDLAALIVNHSTMGLIFGLLIGISYGLFSAFSSTLHNERHQLQYLFVGTFLSGFLLLAFTLLKYGIDMFDLSLTDWIIALFYGFLIDFLGYYMWTKANRKAAELNLEISGIISIMNFLPILSLTLVALVFVDERSEIFTGYFLTALTLVFISSYIGMKRVKDD